MTRETYTEKALRTAKPTALGMGYLGPGLVAEIGEIYGAQAKSVRDQWDADKHFREIRDETGDVAWFLAVIIHVLRDYHAADVEYAPAGFGLPPLARLLALCSRIEMLTLESEDENPTGYALAEPLARQAWDILAQHSRDWTGTTFGDVLRANTEKLAARYAEKAADNA